MKTPFGSQVRLALCIAAALVMPSPQVLGGHWEICRTYSGEREYVSDHVNFGPATCEWCDATNKRCELVGFPWFNTPDGCSGNEYSSASSGVCVPVASAGTSGTITATLTWVPDGPGDSPPAEGWLYEEARTIWFVQSGACNAVGGGTASVSIGGDYSISYVYVGDRRAEIRGTAECKRWSRVNTSSGKIVRSVGIAASAQGGGDCAAGGSVMVGGEFISCRVHTSPSDPLPQPTVPAPWKAGSTPYRPVRPRTNPIDGAAQTGGDPVNLATGAHAYLPPPDITVYNPYGPSVVYQRNFHTPIAQSGHASPGLSCGWVDTYDAVITATAPGTWGALKLTYPNGAEEIATPVMSDGQPTGEFTEPTGAPYLVTGVPSGTTGQWQSVDITWRNQTVWGFAPSGNDIYPLSRIANRVGRFISILRDPANGNRVTSITDDSAPANTLLTFAYDGGGHLSSVTDTYGRKVSYSFGPAGGNTCLLSVSQIASSGTASPPSRWTYDYQGIGNPARPFLTSVTFPSPTGSGTSTRRTNYDTATGKVASLEDANGNQEVFLYEFNNGTRVQVKNPAGVIEQQWIENFDPGNQNVSTGSTDAKGYCSTLIYEDVNNPSRPTRMIDKNGKETTYTYDEFGNVTAITDPRGTETARTYNYSAFPLGRLATVQQGSKTPTNFTYYEPSGLVHDITGPKPGSTDGSTVTTSFTYDALGNVLTKTSPGNNAAASITTTYNYTSDGEYTQPAKIAQPLTVTDNLGHVTHFRYDSRGNVISIVDGLGNETNFTHNIADQPVTVVYPSTEQAP